MCGKTSAGSLTVIVILIGGGVYPWVSASASNI
jgi:hypothetical protein